MVATLEAPGEDGAPQWSRLYLARGSEVSESRPIFTGDVFDNGSDLFAVVQHPCAIRVNGVDLAERILAGPVEETTALVPSQWSKGFYKQFPMPDLLGAGTAHHSLMFGKPVVVGAADLPIERRIACLSPEGVNLLMQRWVFHNTRFVVPTWDFHASISEQYEEADLIEEWVGERVEEGESGAAALMAAHDWLRADNGQGETRQSLLANPQALSHLRAEMRQHLKSLR